MPGQIPEVCSNILVPTKWVGYAKMMRSIGHICFGKCNTRFVANYRGSLITLISTSAILEGTRFIMNSKSLVQCIQYYLYKIINFYYLFYFRIQEFVHSHHTDQNSSICDIRADRSPLLPIRIEKWHRFVHSQMVQRWRRVLPICT